MNDAGREVIGFLCRWTLLALAGFAAVAAMAASVAAAAAARRDLRASVVMSDAVQGLSTRNLYRLRGRLQSSTHRGWGFFLLRRAHDGSPAFANAYKGGIYFELRDLRAGVHRVPYAGVPYGPYAFCSGEVTLVIVKPETGVFLVDAQLAQQMGQAERKTLRVCLGELQDRGQVAFFHPGDAEEFVRARDRLRGLHPNLPIVWDAGSRRGPVRTLWHTRHRVTIVTADADLAVAAAGQVENGFTVCFIGPADPRFEVLTRFRRYDSIADWRETLGHK